MIETLYLIGVVYLGMFIGCMVSATARYVISRAIGIIPEECSVGVLGPEISFKAAGTKFCFTPIFLSAGTKYKDNKEVDAISSSQGKGTVQSLEELPGYKKIILCAVPSLVWIALAWVWLGPNTINELLETGPQLIWLISDFSVSFDFLKIVGQIVEQQGVFVFWAIMMVKIAVFNFLPIPLLDGGRIFLTLIEGFRGENFSAKTHEWIALAGFIVLLPLCIIFWGRVLI